VSKIWQLSAILEICPAATRKMEKLLGNKCPRSACPGKIEGLKGFKDQVAIREGNFGKKGGAGDEGKKSGDDGKKSQNSGSTSHEEKWVNSVGARAAAKASASDDYRRACEEYVDEEEGGEEDEEIVVGKVLLGKDGKQRRFNADKAPVRKDHGFIKKVKDKKKDKNKLTDGTDNGEGGEVGGGAIVAATDHEVDSQKKKSAQNSVKGEIIIIKPQKKVEAASDKVSEEEDNDDVEEEEEEEEEEESMMAERERELQSRLEDSNLIPLQRETAREISARQEAAGGANENESSVNPGKKKRDKTKQVLSLQEFHATSSVALTPGLLPEQQEELERMEQERKDEVLLLIFSLFARR
jgi:hypothetical protein